LRYACIASLLATGAGQGYPATRSGARR